MMIIGQESSLGYKSIKVCSRPGVVISLGKGKAHGIGGLYHKDNYPRDWFDL
jgi:hypothetical protein